MARSLDDMLASLDPERRAAIHAEGERLHADYVSLQDLRKARELTQAALARTLGVQQATVAKYERQSDLLLSTLKTYVAAMGGSLDLVVQFPGQPPMKLERLGEPNPIDAKGARRSKAKSGPADLGAR
jgi:DNA-binding XRE family transcriptional regulator